MTALPPNTPEDDAKHSLSRQIWQDDALLAALKNIENTGDVEGKKSTVQSSPTTASTRLLGKRTQHIWAIAASFLIVSLVSIGMVWQYASLPTQPEQSGHIAATQSHTYQVEKATLVTLSDGSEVNLNAHSQLVFTEYNDKRVAILTTGEAFFSVKRDESRPFSVSTGQSLVTVLGTQFNINKTQQNVWIDVYHGSVAVENTQTHAKTTLVKGDGVRVNSTGIAAHTVSEDSPSWQQGWLAFDDMALTETAFMLSRYSNKPVLLDNITSQIKVSGRFLTNDVKGAITLISNVNGLSLNEFEDSYVLSEKSE